MNTSVSFPLCLDNIVCKDSNACFLMLPRVNSVNGLADVSFNKISFTLRHVSKIALTAYFNGMLKNYLLRLI